MSDKQLQELNIYSFVGDMLLRTIAGRIADYVANEVVMKAIISPLDKLRFRKRLVGALKDEVTASLKSSASEEGIPDEFMRKKAKRIAKDVLRNPDVKHRMSVEVKRLSGGGDEDQEEAIKNISKFLSQESSKEVKKQWKGEGRKQMKESSTPVVEMVFVSPTIKRLLGPFAQDDFDSGTSFMSPTRSSGFSVRRSFIDGLSSELVSISNQGRTLQINPATREAYVSQGNRSVYLGVLDTWTDIHIRKLIIRYLGMLPDAMVNGALRELGLVENEETTTSNIATPAIGMAPTAVPYKDPLTPRRRRRRAHEV